ncbi:XPG/Rad2 endonuclease [Kalmanozyma brasiliensis GHG001]|uniref:Uncharacterized protein n=1 Tax=Kalmanozyma brasiliensis (strain GHG001) TaxID=1365824 RepID=V5ERI6_KALBG|nr:XPG/Rad2 endonuclease [Kalmanozyma brasiliensis GHG001]EST07755.1 XPG/Rad2 endonuclease [Kalmanozyma brasiliensis GHG001]
MGVKGLTSYVKQIQHAVSEQVTVPVETDATSSSIGGPFVIDGWAWIYRAYLDHFTESLRGGDYIGYTLHARHFVNALRSAGLEPIFIFDGPYLPLKIPTVLSRFGESAANNSAFMRSSSRYKPGFQVSMGVFPPLLYDCTLEALRQCNVKVVIEEIEADSAVAEIADKMGGWAVSNDSDFFVLCARGASCRGYVPIDSIEYLVKPTLKETEGAQMVAVPADFDDDGFAPVGKSGRAKGRKGIKAADPVEVQAQLLNRPPANAQEGTLTGIRFTSYSSSKLAAALGIPSSMLSLLAALVGNDYTAPIQRRILDPALPFGPQRITFIANAIKTETQRMASNRTPGRSGTATPSASRTGLGRTGSGWSVPSRGSGSAMTSTNATPIGDAMHPKLDEALAALSLNDPVRFMVQNVTTRILAGVATHTREAYITSGEQEQLVDAIIDSVATYSLLSDPSAIHRSTPGAEFFARSEVKLYRSAYEKGFFDRTLVESLTQRFSLNRMAPEDPDSKSIQSTHARDLRRCTTTTLFGAWGMDWARETLEEPLAQEDAEEEEHVGAIPILAGPGPNKVNWEQEGDPNEMIPVQTPPSSFGSSMYEDEEEDDEEEEVRSRPGSAVGLLDEEEDGVKPAPAVMDYSRKGDRYAGEQCPILSLDALVARHRQELGIEPPQVLSKYLRA